MWYPEEKHLCLQKGGVPRMDTVPDSSLLQSAVEEVEFCLWV